MLNPWAKYEAIQKLCDLVKQCMRDAARLEAGGRDIPKLIEQFRSHIIELRRELSSGEIAKIIDGALSTIEDDSLLDLKNIEKEEFRNLISNEFKACSSYNLNNFVSVKSILRAVAQAKNYEHSDIIVSTSKELSEIIGQNANQYALQLFNIRKDDDKKEDALTQESVDPNSVIKMRSNLSKRLEKKKKKRNISGGIYNTLTGVVFIACNTATLQMKASARLASEHFKAAKIDLFGG